METIEKAQSRPKSSTVKRIFHPWHLWEDYKFNFYGGVCDVENEELALENCRNMFSDLTKFENALKTIVSEWTFACEHNLTNSSLNKIAYLGQASCALLFNVHSQLAAKGYNLLTPQQKSDADTLAELYLELWLDNHKSKMQLTA